MGFIRVSFASQKPPTRAMQHLNELADKAEDEAKDFANYLEEMRSDFGEARGKGWNI